MNRALFFSEANDYLKYIDRKKRRVGIDSFLEVQNICLPLDLEDDTDLTQ